MIYVELFAGLGNQMFQYAAGLRLARKHGTQLKLGLKSFENHICSYGLDVFNISGTAATEEEVAAFEPARRGWRNFFFGRPAAGGAQIRRVKEKHFQFDPEILSAPDGVCLNGYWQSEKYFRDIEADVRREFSLKRPLDAENEKLLAKIRQSASVSLHVRRGDYVSNPKLIHGTCSLDYYERCAQMVCAGLEGAHFFVFTDDPGWVSENLRLPGPMTLVQGNQGAASHKDLHLMSACQNNIIANSSFSWWGAWLNPHPQKTVFAPARWFNKGDLDTKDLVPETWRRA